MGCPMMGLPSLSCPPGLDMLLVEGVRCCPPVGIATGGPLRGSGVVGHEKYNFLGSGL